MWWKTLLFSKNIGGKHLFCLLTETGLITFARWWFLRLTICQKIYSLIKTQVHVWKMETVTQKKNKHYTLHVISTVDTATAISYFEKTLTSWYALQYSSVSFFQRPLLWKPTRKKSYYYFNYVQDNWCWLYFLFCVVQKLK